MLKIEITSTDFGNKVEGCIGGGMEDVCKEFRELGLQILERYPEDMSDHQFHMFMICFGEALTKLCEKYMELHDKE